MARYTFRQATYKTSRADKHIVLHVTFNRDQKRVIATNVYVSPEQWDKVSEKIINHPGEKLLNTLLYKKKQSIQELEATALQAGENFTAEYLDSILYPHRHKEDKPVEPVFTDYMQHALVRQHYKIGTYRSHQKTIRRFSKWFPGLKFRELTYNILAEFDRLCLADGLARNSISGHHKVLKTYINLAYKEGIYAYPPGKHPYANFKVTRIKGSRPYLTADELTLLEAGTLPEHLEDYRQMFLFICYTGLRISDFMRLDSSMIRGDLLHLVPIKTEDSSSAEVHLPLKDLFGGKPFLIWKRYGFDFPNKTAGFDCRLNAALKQIALILGLQKHLTCHVGRHTFLTHIAMKTGNVFAVMNLGGLKRVDTAMVYIHLSEQDNRKFLSNVQW